MCVLGHELENVCTVCVLGHELANVCVLAHELALQAEARGLEYFHCVLTTLLNFHCVLTTLLTFYCAYLLLYLLSTDVLAHELACRQRAAT